MHAFRHFPLDDDIIYRILRFLPDFITLRDTITACRAFFSAFKAHPNSINRAVAYNLVGPALPQALAVARQFSIQPGVDWFDRVEIDTNTVIHQSEARLLQRNASVVHELEDLFSWRYKDRTSKISLLSNTESLRFQRAIYRIWAITLEFPVPGDDEDEDDDSQIEKQKGILDVYPSQELLELGRTGAFLKEIVQWVCNMAGRSPSHEDIISSALASGPMDILEHFKSASPSVVDWSIDPLSEGYLLQPVSELFCERDVSVDQSDSKILLDSINGEGDKCRRCQATYGVDMWNETNWYQLQGAVNRSVVLSDLPMGKLAQNRTEMIPLQDRFFKPTFQMSNLMNEIYDLRTSAYDDWEKQDWLCWSCLSEIIKRHLHLWLVDQKRKEGEQIEEDCWYGYNCRTQVHRVSHAERLNHLCAPTRGDAA